LAHPEIKNGITGCFLIPAFAAMTEETNAMHILTKCVIALAVCLILNACAQKVEFTPAPLLFPEATAIDGSADVTLPVAVEIRSNYSGQLTTQSRWRRAGRLPEGNVYRRIGSVNSIRVDEQMSEAYLVVRANMLVGYYLPVQSTFSPLTPAIPLPQGVFP
jgi:hypothetical protein